MRLALFTPYEPLTELEARLERVSQALRWGAVAQAVVALAVILMSVIAGGSGQVGFFDSLKSALLFNFNNAVIYTPVAVILLLLANVCALLVVMVGMLAREFWALPLTGAVAVVALGLLVWLGFTPSLITLVALAWALARLGSSWSQLRSNPVMRKELRERMRGARAFAVISVYLILMSLFAVLLFLVYTPSDLSLVSSVTGSLGRNLFAGIVGLEMILMIFIAPAFTAGAVTGERERKTYALLQITLLPRPSFIMGKLESALGYIFLLLLSAIPLQSIAFLFGGVTELELILSIELLIVTAIMLVTLGIFFSTFVDRTVTASVRAYTIALGVMIGVPVFGAFATSIYTNALIGAGTGFRGSPLIEAGLIYLGGFLVSLNPISTAVATQQLLQVRGEPLFWVATLNSTGGTIPLVAPWLSFTVLYLTLTAILLTLAVYRIRHIDF